MNREEALRLQGFLKELHQTNPIVDESGTKRWYRRSLLHRVNGPAVEYPNRYKAWFINGKLHREDGPAVEYASGTKEWWMNGQRHRVDGPAIEYSSIIKIWYYQGVCVRISSQEEFLKWLEEHR